MTDPSLYTDLSAYYDLMCSDINYREQCEAAQRVHDIFGNGGKQYLDLACGTGPHIEHFIKQGYQASGLDLHRPMLERAQQRCPSAHFSQQNMRSYCFDQRFDLITCFLYSVHYCDPYDTFTAMLTRTHQALAAGECFVLTR